MSATNGPETPRQKMIGMMYLVLTGMLALNVSSEVLDAFAKVDRGLYKTNQMTNSKNVEIVNALEKAYNDNPTKVKPFLDAAKQLAEETTAIVEKIKKDKEDIVKYKDGEDFDVLNIEDKGNREAAALVMLNNGKATALKNAVHKYRDAVLNKLADAPESLKSSIRENLTLADIKKEGKTISWEVATFEEMPLISSVTLLTLLEGNIRSTETDALNFLSRAVDADSYKVTDVIASITGPTNTISGSKVSFRIFPTAIDATQEFEGVVNGKPFKLVGGQYEYDFTPNRVGTTWVKGYINMISPSGKLEKKEFQTKLEVAAPSVVISPSAMNVFYAGIKNPITVAAAGVKQSDIVINVSGGRKEKVANGYTIVPTVPAGQKVNITTTVNGKNMGVSEFRVKSVPPATPMVGSKRGGRISIAELTANGGVDAILENFPFDGLRYKVAGFSLTATTRGGFTNDIRSSGRNFTSSQLSAIRGMKQGDRLIIDNIVAVGPDGKQRNLPSLVFRIK
ncbi:MAG: gliding motility protein GldM [Flavobacteriaceae bacterium]|nr:gliding motility protein GldM [Flavobacteriaceae bacterium]